jgi:hypothetical protein
VTVTADAMHNLYNEAWSWMNHLDRQEWLLILIGAVAVGFWSLRGFGSRSNY